MLTRAAGAHWLCHNRGVSGQSYRFFGLSGVTPLLSQFLQITDMTALAITCHDVNSVSTLGIYWKTINVDSPVFPLDR